MINSHDQKETYCRMLGHTLSFNYCRTVNEELPCRKVLDCWFEIFPIQEFILKNYLKEEQKKIFAPPKPKLASLISILNNIQKS